MTMLQVLAEMIRTIELLRIIALAEFMHGSQMLKATVPVLTREVGEFLAAVAACIMRGTSTGLALWRDGAVEGGLEAWEGGAGP